MPLRKPYQTRGQKGPRRGQAPRLNFKDFLIYRYANADLAAENDYLARLAMQLLHDENADLLTRSEDQYLSLLTYCEEVPGYRWCLYVGNDGFRRLAAELETAWIEYEDWLCGLKQT